MTSFEGRGTGSAARLAVADEYQTLAIPTEHGPTEARLFDAGSTKSGVIFVGDGAGVFDSPANGLYARLGADLSRGGMSCLWVRGRESAERGVEAESVRAAMGALLTRGVARIGLVGHASGGATVLRAAGGLREIRAVVVLSTDPADLETMTALGSRPTLFVHGTADEAVAPSVSLELYRLARAPKEIRLIDGAGHGLDESPGTVHLLVRAWLERWLVGEVIPIPIFPKTGNAG